MVAHFLRILHCGDLQEEKEPAQCVGVAVRVNKQCDVVGTLFPPLVWVNVPNYTLQVVS